MAVLAAAAVRAVARDAQAEVQVVQKGVRPLELVPFWKPPKSTDKMMRITISSRTHSRQPPARERGQRRRWPLDLYISRYEAASGSFEVVVDLTKRTSLLPSFLAGSETLFVGQGTDIAFVDFSQLKSQAISMNANRTAVTIALPKAQLESAVLNVSQSYVYAQQQGLFNRIGNFFSGNPNGQQQVYILAQQKIQTAARQSPLLTEAQKNTVGMRAPYGNRGDGPLLSP